MIDYGEVENALVRLFDGWIRPSIQFSTGALDESVLTQRAYEFIALNYYAFGMLEFGPKELLKRWAELKR